MSLSRPTDDRRANGVQRGTDRGASVTSRTVAALAACCIALLIPACSHTASDVPRDVLATVAAFEDAVNAYDTHAIRALVTADYTWQSTGPVQSLDEYLAYVDANYENVGFHTERTGERVITTEGDSYIVQEVGVVEFIGGGLHGTTVHRLVLTDRGWLIAQSRWTEDSAESTG